VTTLFQDIRGALTTRANAASGMPAVHAYEGVPITPNVGIAYAVYSLLPEQERPVTFGGTVTLLQGEFHITLWFPSDSGTGQAEQAADSVKDQFVPGDVVTQGQTSVRIEYAERRPAQITPDWITVPVSVGWNLHNAL